MRILYIALTIVVAIQSLRIQHRLPSKGWTIVAIAYGLWTINNALLVTGSLRAHPYVSAALIITGFTLLIIGKQLVIRNQDRLKRIKFDEEGEIRNENY